MPVNVFYMEVSDRVYCCFMGVRIMLPIKPVDCGMEYIEMKETLFWKLSSDTSFFVHESRKDVPALDSAIILIVLRL